MYKKFLIACIVLIGLFIISIIWTNKDHDELKKNGVIVEAQIIRVNHGGRTSGGFECLIKYNHEEKKLSSPSSLVGGKFHFIGKTFPSMYLPDKNILEILITPRDFEEFNIPFPDSLNWVMPYVLRQ